MLSRKRLPPQKAFLSKQLLSSLQEAVRYLFILLLLVGCGGPLGASASRSVNCGDIPAAATHLPQPGGVEAGDVVHRPVPTYGRYNFSTTDYQAVDCAVLKTAADDLTGRTGVPVRMVNRLEDLREGSNAMQIVNNIRVDQLERFLDPSAPSPSGASLFTLYLPPGWTKTEAFPILLRGTGYTQSNNMILMEPFLSDLVARSRENGKRGLIMATSNTGGVEGLGVHDGMLEDVGRFLVAMKGLGGNPQEVVLYGASRGGIVGFVWAANRLGFPYRAVAIFADVPAAGVGRIFDLSLQTYPAILGVFSVILGPDGWKQSDDPTVKADMIETLAGSRTGVEADRSRLPLGYLTDPRYGDRWQALQAVVLGGGFHDEWIPLYLTLELDRLLAGVGVPHLSFLALGSGHQGGSAFVQDELDRFMEHFLRPSPTPYALPRTGRVYLLQNDLLTHQPRREEILNTASLPFTASFPYILGPGQSASLITCGPEGKAWRATLKDGAGATVFDLPGTFTSEECTHSLFSLPAPGDYLWRFEFDGAVQNPTNTSCLDPDKGSPLPAFIQVVDHKPLPAESFIPKCGIGFGLDQYHGPNAIRP